MKFSLSAFFNSETGKYVANLYQDGKLVESHSELRSVKAVKNWARNSAQHHKDNNLPVDTESHSYSASIHL